jgi:5-methylcytosine-specific restriction enzyme subunit McrC
VSSTRTRVAILESTNAQGMSGSVATAADQSQETILRQVSLLNDRLKQALTLSSNPLTVSSSGTWRIDGVSGVLRLSDEIELEVVPKFLDENENWRQDFFLIQNLVRTGQLLVGDHLSANLDDHVDVGTIIARALLRGHLSLERRPVRTYSNQKFQEFSFDGEVDWESISPPSPDGFEVQKISLTKQNKINNILRAALVSLVPQIGDSDTRMQALHISERLSKGPVSKFPDKLPARYAAWRETYELSCFVLDGLGLDLKSGKYSGPGFVISTWQSWQQLCEIILMRALTDLSGHPQLAFHLGSRASGDIKVKPDLTLFQRNVPILLVDAKYKTRFGQKAAVSNADIYESLAFMHASGCNETILIYPSTASEESEQIGSLVQFEQVNVEPFRIRAFTLQTRGISKPGGFEKLVYQLRQNFLNHIDC